MPVTDLLTEIIRTEPGKKPRDDELDLFGLTHPGKVRRENQDHFLVGTVHHQVMVHASSLPQVENLPLRGERLATILMVADGVGGGTAGAQASQLAVRAVTRYVSSAMQCFHTADRHEEERFFQALREAAFEAHAAVKAEAATRPEVRSMATTLTLAIAVWPWMYVLQVGDSRCYLFWDGELHQVTRDQTLAQNLVDKGALPAERAAASPFASVLASAIGGHEASPEVVRFAIRRGCVVLLCSDGLTRHLADEEIERHIRNMRSSEQLCRTLVELALDRGGSDNITVLVGRARDAGPAGP
jgi:protein phosphatase